MIYTIVAILWLGVAVLSYFVLVDPGMRWDWRYAVIAPAVLISLFVTVLLWRWMRAP